MTITSTSPERSSDVLIWSMTDFLHDPQFGVTFESWFVSYEDMFPVGLEDEDDRISVFTPAKLGPDDHTLYLNFILPENHQIEHLIRLFRF